MTATFSPELIDALKKLSGAVPWYSLEAVKQTSTGYEGLLRVLKPDDLPAAMADWKDRWMMYEPRIVADSVDPCLAKWSRWNTCE